MVNLAAIRKPTEVPPEGRADTLPPLQDAPRGTDAMLLDADPELFLSTRRSRLTPRKARLLAVALARHHWHALTDAGRAAVVVAEQHTDGLVSDDALFEAWMAAEGAPFTYREYAVAAEVVPCATCEIADADDFVRHYVLDLANDLGVEPALLVAWLECLLGCAEIPESALTPTVVRLARTIHHEQAWDRAPILADALEESGVTDAAALEHLRCDRHARGCYVLDTVLRSHAFASLAFLTNQSSS